ncbi:MAG: hypothetical protein EB087_01015 [Flavobacteriales bacterium]|nr:hypothetical protein [Flavobacteriales bacterium]
MKISFLLVLIILLNSTINSQDLLEQKEIELNEKLLQLRAIFFLEIKIVFKKCNLVHYTSF